MHAVGEGLGQIRIIAGKYRGRALKVLTHPGLRPTPSRIRETLFNWLNPYIVQACCLDLFAGSGALGFEALSRGAQHVLFVDNYPPAITAIRQSAKILGAGSSCQIIRASAVRWLTEHTMQGITKSVAFDIIFLDPPFASPLLAHSITALSASPFVNENTLIYMEAAKEWTAADLPPTWHILRHKRSGEVAYHLIRGAKW